ncbi:hypothetical protein R3W88_033687 [Solanum pinnatisectum]|uniref:DUF7081 domain-containing protein n=1 Tax=Solanum pinnatisectum TaxID=50273 RepID=A0AAV9K190_9SOLN|nr:hypothetical protein R3W88_033687 [Solanum pinnatisectum]
MSAKEEVGESCAPVVYNGSASRINEFRLQLYPVSEYDSGEGLPYAPVDWPNVGDKWGWRVGKRITSSGTFIDRYMYLPKHFKALKGGTKNVFRNINFDSDMEERTTSSGMKLQSLLSDSPIRAITCKAVNLVFAETVVVSFAAKLSVRTMMGIAIFDMKQQ